MNKQLYKLSCRTFQLGMKIANYVIPYHMPQYIEGENSILRLANIVKGRGWHNFLIVSDPTILSLGLLDHMLHSFDEAHISYTLFTNVEKNPTSKNVEEGYQCYQQHHCQALIGFGGGAAIDCAKAIGAKAVHPKKSIAQLQGILKVHAKIPPFIAIPTTAGTGSETTLASVIIDANTHHKASINDPFLIPTFAVLDPVLTEGLPPQVTATTGMDALCHAIESYTNHTYNTELEDVLAKEAVRLIHDNLYKAYLDGHDLNARSNMQRAAFFAGRSFTRGCVGYVHAIGHTLGGLYGVPHGNAMSIILPHVLRQYGTSVEKRLAELADICGIDGKNIHEQSQNFIAWIEEMKTQMQIQTNASMIKEEDMPQIIKWAMKEANPLYPCVEVWQREDFEKALKTIKG